MTLDKNRIRNELLSAFSYLMATMIGGFAFFYAGFMLLRLLRGSP